MNIVSMSTLIFVCKQEVCADMLAHILFGSIIYEYSNP